MMKPNAITMRKRLLANRVSSLEKDNYFRVVAFLGGDYHYYKLRHRANHNVVELKAYFQADQLNQYTNGKLTYAGNISG